MNMAVKQSRQFHMLTEEEIRSDWINGISSSARYLMDIIRVSRAIGWELRIESVAEFCNHWGMPERAFYRAKAKLISQDLLSEKITGRVSLKITSPDESVRGHDESVRGHDESVRGHDESVRGHDESVRATPVNQPPEGDSSDPTDLLQIFPKFSSDFSQTIAPAENQPMKVETQMQALDSVKEKPEVNLKTAKPRRGRKSSGGALTAKPAANPETFEAWWKSYRQMCLMTDAEPGRKSEAAAEWVGHPEIYESQRFQDGDRAYAEYIGRQFQKRGEVFGISHGCRYLRSDKWADALDRAALSQKAGVDLSNPAAVKAAAATIAKRNEWAEARVALGIEDEEAAYERF